MSALGSDGSAVWNQPRPGSPCGRRHPSGEGDTMKPLRTDAAIAFGRALREARRAAGLSQENSAERGDFGRTYPSLLERGLRTPSFAVIISLADALRTDP